MSEEEWCSYLRVISPVLGIWKFHWRLLPIGGE